MKWLTLAAVLLYLTRHGEAGVLKCSPESQDPQCASEKRNLILPPQNQEVECLAGSEWESNCHSCRCSESGVAECLKQDSCDLLEYGEPIKCKPNTSFRRDCNTCMCLDNGLGLCTLIGCVHLPVPDRTERRRRQANPQEDCVPGTRWKEECNTCRCTDNGLALCTRKGCHIDPSSFVQKRDTTSSNATITRKTRAAPEPAKTCQPGAEFRMDCNKCLCNDEGQDFSCTRIDCTTQNGNSEVDSFAGTRTKREVSVTEKVAMQCEPGTVFDRKCNVCRCTTEGLHAVCTIKRCGQEVAEPSTEATPSFRCTPGDQFKRECNDCTCSADGKTVFCTLRLCDVELADM